MIILEDTIQELIQRSMGGLIGMSSENLIKFINAFDDPYSGAQTMIGNKIGSIKKAQLHDGESPNHPFIIKLIWNDRNGLL